MSGRCRFLFAVLLCLAFVGPVRLKPGYENARENSEIFAGVLFKGVARILIFGRVSAVRDFDFREAGVQLVSSHHFGGRVVAHHFVVVGEADRHQSVAYRGRSRASRIELERLRRRNVQLIGRQVHRFAVQYAGRYGENRVPDVR